MKAIWKFPIVVSNYQDVEMPANAVILCVQVQETQMFGKNPYIWAIVNPSNEKETRRFRTVGTGHEIHENLNNLKYIGTYQLNDGRFIGHLFEVVE